MAAGRRAGPAPVSKLNQSVSGCIMRKDPSFILDGNATKASCFLEDAGKREGTRQ